MPSDRFNKSISVSSAVIAPDFTTLPCWSQIVNSLPINANEDLTVILEEVGLGEMLTLEPIS